MSGGALYLAMGVLAAILEARGSGQGQVADAAIVDGTASMAMTFFGLAAAGKWQPERGTNILDSGAPFYDVYACADGKWISIGPIEARFHAELLERMGIPADAIGPQMDTASWPHTREVLAAAFRTCTRAAWCDLLEGTDVCFAPVLSFAEAPSHPHLKARGTFVEVDGVVQPAPAPRFSRTPSAMPTPPQAPQSPDADGVDAALAAWGLSPEGDCRLAGA